MIPFPKYNSKYRYMYPYFNAVLHIFMGWSGGAMVLHKLSEPGRPTDLDNSRARAYPACSRCGWGFVGYFFSRLSLLSSFFFLPLSGRCRLKYCLKGPLSPKQPINQHHISISQSVVYRTQSKNVLQRKTRPQQDILSTVANF